LLEQSERLATHGLLDQRQLMQPGAPKDRLQPNAGSWYPALSAGSS